jgi:1,2-diacylglycerol 3-alpha-glucosyltransferase
LDILAPGLGCITPAEDVAAFARAMQQLLTDEDRRRRMGEEARRYAREWSDDRLAERLLQLYRELTGRTMPFQDALSVPVPGMAEAARHRA